MNNYARRRSSLDSSSTSTSSSRPSRRTSLTSSVRRSSINLHASAVNDLYAHLGRAASEEAPTTKKERKERRSRRKSDYKQQKEDRTNRMDSITDQWTTHRKSFVSEEMEMAELMKTNSSRWCCGMTLCCPW